jgi:hypothetical protein
VVGEARPVDEVAGDGGEVVDGEVDVSEVGHVLLVEAVAKGACEGVALCLQNFERVEVVDRSDGTSESVVAEVNPLQGCELLEGIDGASKLVEANLGLLQLVEILQRRDRASELVAP